MTTELQKFMKKVVKMDKSDYTLKVYPIATNSDIITQFHITLNDKAGLYADFTDGEKVKNLLDWLREYYDEIDDYEEERDNGDITYYFHADNFSVRLEFLSNHPI